MSADKKIMTLNQTEQEIVDSLPESQREVVKASILAKKQAAYNRAEETRNTFKTKVFDGEKLSVYGLAQKFPITMRRKGWERLIANLDAIKAEVSKLPQ